MTCLSVSNLSDYLPHTFDGILTQFYSQFINKLVCFPDYLIQVAAWWKSGAISDKEAINLVTYLIEKGIIYIT